MQMKFNGLWLAFFSLLSMILVSCGNSTAGVADKQSKVQINAAVVQGNPPPPVGSSGQLAGGSNQPPYQIEISGVGNHARHVCIPVQTYLVVRVKPHANYAPLMPLDVHLTYADGTLVYDGLPAYYGKLRVRLSIPGTAAAWDYLANNEDWSTPGDYTAYLRTISAGSVRATGALRTPEYQGLDIYGSDPNDGMCTYWERQLGKCTTLSSDLRASEAAGCNAGEQKILITNIVSDFPCTSDRVGWCKGGGIQTVPDYQQWSITIEAMTEATRNFL